ncbi:Similar to ZC3H14: Zinc finger CCCH domain-containing protein 14 (Bos taurus) [Cotesia congregata]|uniref:Zinc finger CCCH domain-containing protein 14 n=1 Tax=Cotesia congregata TaxID=51543 RepID=A0A8J2MPW1_COTCN|nr:Similar to ZC3H14: Zinc finger CCCH domain-containing protein 14 (Bos taurus) [Cotesia congregata]
MDVRGIEVTNQLRSAIRAKLLELGVRYDEELPDYILVMVVNKKTRQQMHEDLNLFLEDSTTPFVDWLHDQVLKKLQKVTVAKQKKAQREFVPTVVVKQEEEKRKKKIGDELKVKNEPVNESKATTPPVVSPAPKSPSLSPRPRVNSESSKAKVVEENEQILEPEKVNQVPVVEDKVKRSIEDDSQRPDKRLKSADSKDAEADESEGKKLKSCVNKPRITSVVSVKTRLGLARNKFEVQRNERERVEAGRNEADRRQADKRADRRLYEPRRDSRGRDDKRSRSREEKNRVVVDKRPKEDRDREKDRERERRTDRAERTIKDRLGQMKPGGKFKDKPDEPRNVRSRLGPVKSKFIALGRLGVKVREDDKQEDDDDEEEEVVGPVRSRIIAVNNVDKPEHKDGDKDGEEEEEEDKDKDKDKVIASKVIVTPRPLKPLQPAQKRATQSLLLRAVAEANQSVVKQKNPEPALLDKKPVLKRLQPINMRTSGQNFSVHLNATKRLVMEKIQVELTTSDSNRTEPEPYVPRAVTDEQMGVVMSLFKRGNDNQKFLVTLNGYNNNVNKEDSYSEDDGLEMEVNEDDELILNNSQSESFITNSGISLEAEEIDDTIDNTDSNLENSELDNLNITEEVETIEAVDDQEKIETAENNENQCTDNINNLINEVTPPKRRKLSPIVYTRSPSPEKTKTVLSTVTAVDKKSSFGLSCTKLGCVFSHPSQQCKYHPFCTKPGCMYLHPQAVPAPVVIPAAATASAPLESVRAKFTWRRRD